MKTSSKIAIAAAAVGAWLIAKKKGVVSGVGNVISSFREAYVTTKDGNDAINFYVRDDGWISVAYVKKYGSKRYPHWETHLYEGSYETLEEAKRAAKKLKRLYYALDSIDDKDFDKI